MCRDEAADSLPLLPQLTLNDSKQKCELELRGKSISQRETFRLQRVAFYLSTRNRYDNGSGDSQLKAFAFEV